MVALKNILLLVSTVTAAVISKRDVNALFRDLDSLNAGCIAIVPIVNSWTGDLNGALKINTAQNAISAGVIQAATDATATVAPITDDQTNTLFTKVDSINGNLVTLANAFKAKKPLFDGAGFTPVVVSQITTVFASFHNLQVGTSKLVPVAYQAAATAKGNAINGVLKDLLSFFGGVDA